LSGILAGLGQRGFHGVFQAGILEHDGRRFATELHRNWFHVGSCQPGDALTGICGSGEPPPTRRIRKVSLDSFLSGR
jgi:hypothetical protein